MRLTSMARLHAALWSALALYIVAGAGCEHHPPAGDAMTDSHEDTNVIVSEASQKTLQALAVVQPQQERWRDIGDGLYAESFRDSFSYAEDRIHRAEVFYESAAPTLTGTVSAISLKPWFAYQVKLVGAAPLAGATEAENLASPEEWSSFQLGSIGRWWCADCLWNVTDADLPAHLDDGHSVNGYLLFDWFVTDGAGNAEHPFALDSSLRVLWRVEQRERGRWDTPPRWYELSRDTEFYPAELPQELHRYGIFAEWEPERPVPGAVSLPPGDYVVRFNLTEETFHANLDERRMLEGAGFWALVLDGELRFEVRPLATTNRG